MAYGSGDIITGLEESLTEALDVLLEVATKKKTVTDVRGWLEENYPKLTTDTTTAKKW